MESRETLLAPLQCAEKLIIAELKNSSDYQNEREASERLWDELEYYRSLPGQIHSIQDLYHLCLRVLINKRMMPSVIKLTNPEKEKEYERLFFGWDPQKVLDAWQGKEKELAREVLRISPSKEGHGQVRGDLRTQFAYGALASAAVFSEFKDLQSFWAQIDIHNIWNDPHQGLAFFTARKKIPGMGIALHLHFFQRLGSPYYAKPDSHVIEAMNTAGYKPGRSPSQAAERLFEISSIINGRYVPYVIDKLLWLLGTGNLCDAKPAVEIPRVINRFKNQMNRKD